MQVLRENDHGIDGKRVIIFYIAGHLAQQVDVINQQVIAMALGAVNREKIGCSGDFYPAVIGHPPPPKQSKQNHIHESIRQIHIP